MAGTISQPQPLKSRSTVFFERYARAENENLQLRMVVLLLAGLLAILMAGFVYISVKPKAIYYIPGAVRFGVAYPGAVPESSVISFAESWLLNWMNYAPDTVEGVYERSLKYMAPVLLSQVHAQAASELEKVKRDRLSSVFMITASPVLEETRGGFNVVFSGRRVMYMGKEELSSVATRYILGLVMAPATDINPYGLAVAQIKKEEALDDGK